VSSPTATAAPTQTSFHEEKIAQLETQVIKMRTDNEIMSITMKHLQDELNMKSDLIRRQ